MAPSAAIRVPVSEDSSLATRNDDRALRPRSERSSAIDTGMRVKPDYTPLAAPPAARKRRIHPPRPAAARTVSVLQNLRQEQLCALGARLAEEVVLARVLDDPSLVHEDHPMRDLACKSHLVGDHHHRHAFLGKADH